MSNDSSKEPVKIFSVWLNFHPDSQTFVLIAVFFFFSGWGKTIGGGTGAEVLQEAMLPVAYHKTCREKMKVVRKVHKGTMLCAGGQGKGGCQVKKCRYHFI